MIRPNLLISILLITVFTAVCLSQTYYVAAVYDFTGEVKVFKGKENVWKNAFKYMPLEEKDKIKTDKSSFCDIVLDDGSMIKLNEKTELLIKYLRYELKKQKYRFSLQTGKLHGAVNKLSTPGSRVSIKTPTSVAAVRGTDFAIIATTESTNIGLFEGKLAVSSQEAEEEEEEAEEEAGFLAPTTAYEEAPAVSTPTVVKKEVVLEPNNEVTVAKKEEPVLQAYLSRTMEREKRRCERLREVADKIREKLQARSSFLQDRIKEQEEKLKDFDKKREEKLKRYKLP
ncbi:MAG: FecR family protein [Elusimicrobiota bacterium]